MNSLRWGAFKRVPVGAWVLIAALVVSGFFVSNAGLTVALALLLAWIFLLLYRPGEPPILLLAAGFQWLQVGTKVLHANFLGVPVDVLAQYNGDVDQATWLSIGALFFLVWGIRLAIGRYRVPDASVLREEALRFVMPRMIVVYAAASVASVVLMLVARSSGGLYQALLALANLKWAVYFVLAYVCFVRPKYLWLFALAFGFELVLSLGGFFADFKVIFFVSALAFLSSGRRLKGLQYAGLGVLFLLLLAFSLAWTSVKKEYRLYLSGGTGAQIVAVGYDDRVQELVRQVAALTIFDYADAATDMAKRVAYVDFFGNALDWVPSNAPHTGGEQWGGAVLHILTPRFLWPGKPPLPNDSEVTIQYTGLYLPSDAEGTSISLGYAAESYIDFGLPWMFVPLLFLGWVWGRLYRFFMNRKTGLPILNQALTVPVLLMTMQYEAAVVKLVGAVVTGFLVAWLAQRYFSARLERFLIVPDQRVPVGPKRPVHGKHIR